MKTILPKQELQDCLAAVATLTGGRSTRPILNCVRFECKGDLARFSATDGEAGLHVTLSALSVARAGEVVVPAQRLLDIVRELPDPEVAIEADERYCTIRGEGSEFRIFVMSPADFPPVPAFEEEPDFSVSGRLLRKMIHLTLYAAAREMSRYAINGVQWEKKGKRLCLIATDGRRLARAGGDLAASSAGDFDAIVPSKALGVFEKVFMPPRDGDDWRIDLKVLPNQLLMRSGGRVLSTVLVEGQFPRYQDVIPKSSDKRMIAGREELFSAVRRAGLLTTEDARAVRLSLGGGKLVITSQSPDRGDARVQMPVEFEGKEIEIGFNPAFLSDALSRMTDCDQVTLELQESFRPGVLSAGDKDEFLYVVMPVSLSG
ncbi:MAG: DNA polymerase III subunit beta [Phycisphaerae bacterium]|jgi:DNA polymerase-3 subunit beta